MQALIDFIIDWVIIREKVYGWIFLFYFNKMVEVALAGLFESGFKCRTFPWFYYFIRVKFENVNNNNIINIFLISRSVLALDSGARSLGSRTMRLNQTG